MRPSKTPIYSPPKYCSEDGMVLEEHRSDLGGGYDAFTGIALPTRSVIMRRCPTDAVGHDVWVLVDDQWVTP